MARAGAGDAASASSSPKKIEPAYRTTVADELKAPVAIRITRPYATEDEFLEREFDTLTHTSVILLGAQSRPQGVVLRFEITLKSGDSILRGEGRVVAYKERAYGGEPGLTLRFTRLDSRSKSLVDRASALREARVRGSVMAPAAKPAEPVPPPKASSRAPERASQAPERASQAPARAAPPASTPPPPSGRRGPPPLPEWARSGFPPPPSHPPPAPPSSAEEIDIDASLGAA